jgi:hypothetical protein
MRRLFAGTLMAVVAIAAVGSSVAQVKETGDAATFNAKVGIIVKWINQKTDATTTEGELSDWSNAQNTNPRDTDSVAVLRLVTNVDVRLQGTVGPLTHPDNANETLATFVCIQTDGDGSEDSLIDGTGDPATGFTASEYNAANGVGPEYDEPRRNFVYVGGGSTAAGENDLESWVTPERLAELSNVPEHQATFQLGTLLGTAPAIRHVPRDGAVLIRITMRALSGEDFGLDSDDTEAPDLATETPYSASVQLTALP